MSYLADLTTEQILSEPLPLKQILNDSYYYPASAFDGQLVKFAPNDIINFVYCDYKQGQTALLKTLQQEPFYGYSTLVERNIRQEELIPNGWRPQLPPNFSMQAYSKIRKEATVPFATWFVFERQNKFHETHGPARFSLLYVGGEGIATYQALYWTNDVSPKALAIIQPGTGWGGNWTDFGMSNGDLHWVVYNSPHGLPAKIYYGGQASGYAEEFDWKGYKYETKITPYYKNNFGEVTVWGWKPE